MSVIANEFGYYFNSNSGDRKYNADSFEKWLKPFFVSGVFAGDLQVTAQTTPDMTVSVAGGFANLDGKPAYWPSANTLAISTASGMYDRIDTIVLRRDNVNRQISIEVVTGTASGSPQPTAPTRDADTYELVLAQILVGVGVTSITAANITDTRTDPDICGYVTATVDQMDFSQFTTQFEGWIADFEASEREWQDEVENDFTEWFAEIRGQLSTDAAGNLQNQIDDLKANTVKLVDLEAPDDYGNVNTVHASAADQLLGDDSIIDVSKFTVRRTANGKLSESCNARLCHIYGNRIRVGYVPEELNMTVNSDTITATIDRDTFVSYVSTSGTTTLTYTTGWSADPTLYGVTVTGTPANGDEIVIVYVKEVRGTIRRITSGVRFCYTGMNLYRTWTPIPAGYYRVVGTYSSIKYAETKTGTKLPVYPDADGFFSIPTGFMFVEGGNNTDTMVYMAVDEWADPNNVPTYEENSWTLMFAVPSGIDGFTRVGPVRDEVIIKINKKTVAGIEYYVREHISRVERLTYSAANRAAAEATGRYYEFDSSYIYLERATPEITTTTSTSVMGPYTANKYGIEFFIELTDALPYVPVEAEILYGEDLKADIYQLQSDVTSLNDNLIAQNNNRIFSNTDVGNNLNNATSPGMVVYTGGQAASMGNAPFSGQGAYVLVFGMDPHFVQIAMNRNTGGITQVAFRACIEGTWTAWKKLTPS